MSEYYLSMFVDQALADIRVRDAAQQLLAACKQAKKWIEEGVCVTRRIGDEYTINHLREAIAAAEGEKPCCGELEVRP